MSRYEKYMVSACELYDSDSFRRHIQVPIINLCVYGSGRSCEASKILDDIGYQSLFLSCGLAGLEDFHPNYRQEIISRLKQFSQIFIFTNEIEKNTYQDTICELNVRLPNFFRNEIEFEKQIRQRKITLQK